MGITRIRLSLVALAATAPLLAGQPVNAASVADKWPPMAGVGDVRLNGHWHVDEAARAESTRNARAQLTPAGQAIAERNRVAGQERQRRGEMVNTQAAICGLQGVPAVIGTSEPWFLVIGKDVVVWTAERYQLSPRYFYADGRTLADVDKLPRSTSGYSIAHWEGKTLVVETRGLPPGGAQGGGLKGSKTKLIERASLDETGDRLTWTYTWEDPELLVQPYSYSIYYDRGPPNSYSMYQVCDPNQGASRLAEEPPQEGPVR